MPPPTHTILQLFRLDGLVAIVTGGMGRLGSQYVQTLTEAGASVAIFDLPGTTNPRLQPLIDEGRRVAAYAVDASNRRDVDRAMSALTGKFGAASVLVNNAGLGASPADTALETGPFESYPLSAWDAMLDSHLKSALVVSQAFVAQFKNARRTNGALTGSIINVSSTYGMVAPTQSLYDHRRKDGTEFYKPVGYSVAKSGMLNFTRWLAEYGAPLGLRANTLVPGGVREASHAPEFVAAYERHTPLGRMANDDDYNGAVLFLASQASAYMTGATLVVDGGWTAR